MTPVAVFLVAQVARNKDLTDEEESDGPKQTLLTWGFITLVIIYVLVTIYVGYFVASFVVLITAMYALGLRQPPLAVAVAAGWALTLLEQGLLVAGQGVADLDAHPVGPGRIALAQGVAAGPLDRSAAGVDLGVRVGLHCKTGGQCG